MYWGWRGRPTRRTYARSLQVSCCICKGRAGHGSYHQKWAQGWGVEGDKSERDEEGRREEAGGRRKEGFEGQSKKAGCMRIAWGKEEMNTSGNNADHGNQNSNLDQSQSSSLRSERVKLRRLTNYIRAQHLYLETYFPPVIRTESICRF